MLVKPQPKTVLERPVWRDGECGEVKTYLSAPYGSGFVEYLTPDESVDDAGVERPADHNADIITLLDERVPEDA